MKALTSLRKSLEAPELLGSVLGGPSWLGWRSLLLAAMGESLTAEELAAFTKLTERTTPPPGLVEEFWGVIGRCGGKSNAVSALAVYLGGMCDYSDVLSPGERGVVLVIAPDSRQARIDLDYAEGILRSSPVLAQLLRNRTADALELSNNITIEVRSASFRRLRGLTLVAAVCDEAAFWFDADSSANPDAEILNAVRPSLATTRGPLIVISSPYARKGEMWETYNRHFGEKGDPLILVAQGASRELNPSLPQVVVDRAYERNPARAIAEYGGEFRVDVEALLTIEAVRGCVDFGLRERVRDAFGSYVAFVDPSGGSSDSMTLAIAHKKGGASFLDAVRERRPPFSPEAVCEEFAELLARYSITKVTGDAYGGEWPREQFRKHGVNYEVAKESKSELYQALVPLINSREVNLLDHDRLVAQLVGLERRTGSAGRDKIDHGPGGHDDIANCVAGALTRAFKKTDARFSNRNLPTRANVAHAEMDRRRAQPMRDPLAGVTWPPAPAPLTEEEACQREAERLRRVMYERTPHRQTGRRQCRASRSQ